MHLDTIVILVSFLLNILISIYSIVADSKGFSLNKTFWIFSLLFLSIIPLGQFLLGTFPWGRSISNTLILKANALILMSHFVYTIVRQKSTKHFQIKANFTHIWNLKTAPLIGIYVIASISIIALSNQGQFWLKSNGISIENSTLQLVIDKGLKGICLIGILLSIHLFMEKKINRFELIPVLIIGLMANFPTAIPRYWLATLYIAAILVFLKHKLEQNKRLFEIALISASLILFPLLSVLRFNNNEIKAKFHSLQDIFSFSFLGGDYDAYSSLCTTIQYVQTNGITWGKQLATVMLFFIPRNIWEGKSVGSGALVNKLEHSDFTNFSSPFIAEGYINFGILGAILFIGLLSYFIVQYDNLYWSQRKKNYNFIVYPAAIGMLYFILRGDLLSSFAYSVGLYVAGWLYFSLIKKEPKSNN